MISYDLSLSYHKVESWKGKAFVVSSPLGGRHRSNKAVEKTKNMLTKIPSKDKIYNESIVNLNS